MQLRPGLLNKTIVLPYNVIFRNIPENSFFFFNYDVASRDISSAVILLEEYSIPKCSFNSV